MFDYLSDDQYSGEVFYPSLDKSEVEDKETEAKEQRTFMFTMILFISIIVIAFLSIELTGLFYGLDVLDVYTPEDRNFEANIEIHNILTTLNDFETIAKENKGSRSVNTGYNASAEYVLNRLQSYGDYFEEGSIQSETFSFLYYQLLNTPQLSQLTPSSVNYRYQVDFLVVLYSGSRDITGDVVLVEYGCNNDDYIGANFQPGNIALVIYNQQCTPNEIAQIGISQNAGGMLLYPGDLILLSTRTAVTVPMFTISKEAGEELTNLVNQGITPTLRMSSTAEERPIYTTNIIAETPGNSSRVIISGSHLDSSEASPGINDNGSGSATNLEIALQFAKNNVQPVNRIRFAWWGAEELGLRGSTYYVDHLEPNEVNDILVNLNYDSIGSPNGIRMIFNGTDGPVETIGANNQVMRLYENFFELYNLTYTLTDYNGLENDDGPFLMAGIPSGGIFTGKDSLKTVDQRNTYGGMANAPYDPCYHLQCDTIENINQSLLNEMSKAAASVLYNLSMEENLVNFLNTGNE